jgi:hypothetical protein
MTQKQRDIFQRNTAFEQCRCEIMSQAVRAETRYIGSFGDLNTSIADLVPR